MKRIALLGFVLAGLLAGTAQAGYEVRLPASEARAEVRETGGFVHRCERLAPRRFRCTATYWKVEHTAEEVEPGRWVEVSAVPVAEEATLLVSLTGVRRVKP
jgi:hypothetical protein